MTRVLWRGSWTTRARIISGLVLMLYVVLHLLNIASVLISPEVSDAFQDIRLSFTRSMPVQLILALALSAHVILALAKLLQRRTLRLPLVDWVQIGLGLMIPLLLSSHIIYTNIAAETLNVNTRLGYLAALIWRSTDGWLQAVLLCATWIHGCIGLHMWLRLTAWWRRSTPWILAIGVLIPTLALVGYVTAGRAVTDRLTDPDAAAAAFSEWRWPGPDGFRALAVIDARVDWVIVVLLLLFLIALILRRLIAAIARPVRITYVDGPTVRAPRHQTVLETSQSAGVEHTALCGGRGRCTTCRIVVEEGADNAPPPSEAEQRSLAAVDAPPGTRLACQMRPTGPVTVFRVFRNDGKRRRAHASQGKESRLAVLFLDMRGFTARTDGQLPYDVVFLLNRFFDQIVPPIVRAGGTIDKYMGDGLMAVFETTDAASSARAALRAIEGIGRALDGFNETLAGEGSEAVAIGIGVHLGTVVLGEIGAAGQAPRTLIGDTVNTASRLESETKVLGVQALVSIDVLEAAGGSPDADDLVDLTLRGRDSALPALPVTDATALLQNLAQYGLVLDSA
jgi:adenylate cyclase